MGDIAVARVQTLCAPRDMYDALHAAWLRCAQDAEPGRASLLVLVAHWALETGFGHSCWNWNIGNKKRIPGRDFYYVRCNEIIGGKEVWYDPPAPACAFASYPDLASGVLDYFVGLRGQFRAAWPAVLNGDPSQFCHLLKLAHYYTADEAVYTSGVVRCYRQLDGAIPVEETAGDATAYPHE
jgi:hypothetical protein